MNESNTYATKVPQKKQAIQVSDGDRLSLPLTKPFTALVKKNKMNIVLTTGQIPDTLQHLLSNVSR